MGSYIRQLAFKKQSWIYFAVTVGMLGLASALLLPLRPVARTSAICGSVWLLTGIAVALASDHRVVRAFSLKQMLISLALVTIGVGSLVLPFRHGLPIGELSIALWFSGGPLIGAGFCSLYNRPVLGAVIGMTIGAFIQGAVFWLVISK